MNSIYSIKEFHRILEREQARTDRTDREFSIMAFQSSNSKFDKDLIQYLCYTLNQRVRCYDLIGWIDELRLGVILPETQAEHARKLAENICKTIIPRQIQPRYTVFSYPSDWANGKKETPHPSLKKIFSKDSKNKPAGDNDFLLNELGSLLPKRMPSWKRVLDLICAFLALVALFPLLLLMGIFIKAVSRGPALFKQQRVGYLGKTFNCLKFRTMHLNANQEVHQQHLSELIRNNNSMNKLDDRDSRIIPLGKFFRKTGLDELPQLVNVIRGEMSLIGPRPCIPYEVQEYLAWQHKRFEAVPGLSGLWQVSGKNRTTFNEMMRLDISYTKKKSLWLDVKILFKTLPTVIAQISDKKEGGKNEKVVR